jgi:hypothetical protein
MNDKIKSGSIEIGTESVNMVKMKTFQKPGNNERPDKV